MKSRVSRSGHQFLSGKKYSSAERNSSSDRLSELDEFDIWDLSQEEKRSATRERTVVKMRSPGKQGMYDKGSSSLPVNVPDWSRNLREENRRGRLKTENGKNEEPGDWIPPHEVVARRAKKRRAASFSLQEGAGRTLKGRDLCQVRNAIWEKMGFQD